MYNNLEQLASYTPIRDETEEKHLCLKGQFALTLISQEEGVVLASGGETELFNVFVHILKQSADTSIGVHSKIASSSSYL